MPTKKSFLQIWRGATINKDQQFLLRGKNTIKKKLLTRGAKIQSFQIEWWNDSSKKFNMALSIHVSLAWGVCLWDLSLDCQKISIENYAKMMLLDMWVKNHICKSIIIGTFAKLVTETWAREICLPNAKKMDFNLLLFLIVSRSLMLVINYLPKI